MSRRQKDLFPELPDGKKYVSDIPELVAQWHPTKNGELLPEDISYGSGRKFWWRCAEGHEWVASANMRTNLKSGCPQCSVIRVAESHSQAFADYNLFVVNPELCEEWHPKNQKLLSEYLPKSGKKVWWQCTKDAEHVWKAQIASRTDLEGNTLIGCPFCSGKRASRKYNLSTERPELLSEWCYEKNQIKPVQLTPNSHTKVWWRCERGHEWEQTAFNIERTKSKNPCPLCKTLAGRRPDIAGLLHPTKNGKLTGYELGYWSTKKVWWQCHSNPDHEWQASASVMVRPSRKALCQYCPPERIQHSNSETHPLMEQAFHREKNGQLTPQNTSAGTGKKLWWICSNDPSHEWQATGANMKKVQRPDLCPTCRKTK